MTLSNEIPFNAAEAIGIVVELPRQCVGHGITASFVLEGLLTVLSLVIPIDVLPAGHPFPSLVGNILE